MLRGVNTKIGEEIQRGILETRTPSFDARSPRALQNAETEVPSHQQGRPAFRGCAGWKRVGEKRGGATWNAGRAIKIQTLPKKKGGKTKKNKTLHRGTFE